MLAALGTPPDGLAPGEAAERLARDGPNALEDRGGRRPWRILVEQFRSVTVLVLVAAAAVALWANVTDAPTFGGQVPAIVCLVAVAAIRMATTPERDR